MSYITTKLQPIKSYPTYQFYSQAESNKISPKDIFNICILETFRWLRSRLKAFDSLPDEILTLSPNEYMRLSEKSLRSFNYVNGLTVDVTYIAKKGTWSFSLTEADMGANLGTPTERKAVSGRIFNTEISFGLKENHVDIGIRTICSEPADSTADCEVFRPTVVKALFENENIILRCCGLTLDGKPLMISSKNEFYRFCDVYDSIEMNYPVIIFADSKTEVKTEIPESPLNDTISLSGFSFNTGKDLHVSLDSAKLNIKQGKNQFESKKEKPKKTVSEPALKKQEQKVKLPLVDYEEQAKSLIGFAVVCFADEKFFSQIEQKTHISVRHGDIIVISHQKECEHFRYKDYSKDIKAFSRIIKAEMKQMPKYSPYSFGEIMFHSDAKLQEYHVKRHETTSLEEQCRIHKLEIAELKEQVRKYSQQNTNLQILSDELRITRRKYENLQSEYEESEENYRKLIEKSLEREEAYRKSADIIAFLKEQITTASSFPTDKNEICGWAEENYSDEIFVSQRAKSEMRKYSGIVDVPAICDGIVYLDAYAKYRRKEISEEMLQLYAERGGWEVQNCGKETLKMRRSDYSIMVNDKTYLLDLHIKRGVSSQELIRIYFCWDEEMQKLVIGSMPAHLATVKQST